MDNVTISWSEGVYKFSDLNIINDNLLDNNGFYVIYTVRWNPNERNYSIVDLLYLGQAFGQSLRLRIGQDHESAYDCIRDILRENNDLTLVFKIGTIYQCSLSRISQEFIDDIESCLIYRNQPRCNSQNTVSYNGRVIGITNQGDHPLIKQYSQCGEYRI